MASAIHRAIVGLAGLCLGGCAGMPATVQSYKLPVAPRAIVLVLDGAGGYQGGPRSVLAAVEGAGLPLYVRSFDWTHGRGRALADITDTCHAKEQAHRLAEEICRYRATALAPRFTSWLTVPVAWWR